MSWNSHKYRHSRYQVLADGDQQFSIVDAVSQLGHVLREKQAEFTASLQQHTSNHLSFHESDQGESVPSQQEDDDDVIITNDEQEQVCIPVVNEDGEEDGAPGSCSPLDATAAVPLPVPSEAPSVEQQTARIRASMHSVGQRRRSLQQKISMAATTDEFLATATITVLVLCLAVGGHAWGMRRSSRNKDRDLSLSEAAPERKSRRGTVGSINFHDSFNGSISSSHSSSNSPGWVVGLLGQLHALVTQISTLAIAPAFPTSSMVSSSDPQSTEELQSRMKELKLCLQKEIKAKQDLQDQTVLLKSALDEQRNTVQVLTSEVQGRYTQLSKFEEEHRQVQTELASQVELLKTQLDVQQQAREGNLSATEEQCAALTNQIEKLTSELQKREEQWKTFEETVQAKEMEAAAQIEVLECKLQAQEDKQRQAQLVGGEEDPRMALKVQELSQELEARKSHVARLEHQLETTQELADSRMNELQQQVQELAAERDALQQATKDLQQKVEEEQAKIHMDPEALAKYDGMKAELEALQQELAVQQEKQTRLESSDDDVRQLLVASEVKCASLTEQVEQLTQELERRNQQIAELEQTVDEQTKQLQVRQEQLDKMNETTLEMVQLWEEKEHQVDAVNAQLDSLNEELKQRNAQVKRLEQSLEQSAKQNGMGPEEEKKEDQTQSPADLESLRKAREEKRNAFTSQLDALKGKNAGTADVSDLENEIKAKNELSAKVSTLESQLFLLQQEVSSAKSQTVQTKDMLTEKEEQCTELISQLESTKSELQKLQGSGRPLQLQNDAQAEAERQEQEEMARKLEEMIALLEQKSNDCANNTARLETLKSELEVREKNVKEVEKKARSKTKLRAQIESLEKELKTQKEQSDAMRKQFAVKAGQVKALVQQRDETIAELQAKVKALEEDSSPETQIPAANENPAARIQELEAELEAQKDQQAKMNNTLQQMIQLVEEKEQECERLTSRVDSLTNELSSSKLMDD